MFWLFAALGVGVGGQLAGLLQELPQAWYFGCLGMITAVTGLLLAVCAKPLAARLR